MLIPRLLQPQADRVADRFAFVGPVLDRARLDTETWTPPRDAERIAYVALGTAFTAQPAFFRACAEALAGDGRHVVLAIGERVDPAALGDLGPAVEVHRAAPQLGVLAHADVFLTHAGMGSAAEALWFGVPTICFPQAVDQFANAEQLVALGPRPRDHGARGPGGDPRRRRGGRRATRAMAARLAAAARGGARRGRRGPRRRRRRRRTCRSPRRSVRADGRPGGGRPVRPRPAHAVARVVARPRAQAEHAARAGARRRQPLPAVARIALDGHVDRLRSPDGRGPRARGCSPASDTRRGSMNPV